MGSSKPKNPKPSPVPSQPFVADIVDDIEVSGINEVQYSALAYPNLALVGLVIKASEQISGGIPQAIIGLRGRIVATESGTPAWTQNPAWCAQDLLINTRYGLGSRIPGITVDQTSAESFADVSDELIPKYSGSVETEKRYEFDAVLDSRRAGSEQVLSILATARGSFAKYGDTIKFLQEKPKTPLQLFSTANIIADTLQISYASRLESPNMVEVSYLDGLDLYEQNIQAAEPAIPPEDERKLSATLYGIARSTQAKRAAYYLLRANQMPVRSIEFEAPVEAIVIEPGDVFIFAHDIPNWADSGRVAGTSLGNVQLDRSLTFTSGVVYSYLERDEDGTLTSTDFLGTGTTTDTLGFAPLHAGDPTGGCGRSG